MGGISAGEILLILVLSLIFLDPKDAGKAWARFQKWRRQFKDLTDSVKSEMAALTEPLREASATALEGDWWNETDPQRLREWSKERLAIVDAEKAADASREVVERLRAWSVWRDSREVALFSSTAGEIPTQAILEAALAEGKRVWMPWIGAEPGIMDFAPVTGSGDLVPGRFGILAPRAALQVPHEIPDGLLVLVPGTVFDHHGHRIGRGKGYYDRWLARHPSAVRTGLCFDVQIHPGTLAAQPHDMPMHHLLTEYRLESFSNRETP